MGANRQREYQCSVVDETIRIHLCKKTKAGRMAKSTYFVQCDQMECQYVDENLPPCPLSLSLFEKEIRERDELAVQRRGSYDDY